MGKEGRKAETKERITQTRNVKRNRGGGGDKII